MAAASMNRPPVGHLGSDGDNAAPQDLGLQGPSQEAGPSVHPQHMPSRPMFYVHAPPPPPPPYLPYQWPVPFSYNPFTSFPGMGYGLVMPPFPVPPYLEAPAYILPQPHLQPVDYRRMLHSQAPPNNVHYQNLNQTRRVRPPHCVPAKETVDCEVQTESIMRGGRASTMGNPGIVSDSGHETASNSPSSSNSSSYKQTHVEKCNSVIHNVTESSQLLRMCTSGTDKHGCNMPHPTGQKTSQSCFSPTSEMRESFEENECQENGSTYRNAHCSTWSVNSPDAIVPVSSPCQREDEVSKERRESVPDILMSWSGTPQANKAMKVAEKVLSSTANHLPSCESDVLPEKSFHRPTETKHDEVMAGNINPEEGVKDVISLDGECDLLDNETKIGNETVLHEETTDSVLHQPNNCQVKRKINESVWSVESLVGYVPSREWMMQNAMFGPQVLDELAEEAENVKRFVGSDDRETCRLSFDSVPMSDSWLTFSSPTNQPSTQYGCGLKTDTSELTEPLKQDQNVPVSPPNEQHVEMLLSTPNNHVERKGSSEPEAHQSPNQESLILPEQLEGSISYAKEEMSSRQPTSPKRVDFESEGVVYGDEVVAPLTDEQLGVQRCPHCENIMPQSKGHLVDCGTQCQYTCERRNKRQPFKNSDGKKGYSGKPDNVGVTGQMHKKKRQYQNKSHEKTNTRSDGGFGGKKWKSNGGS